MATQTEIDNIWHTLGRLEEGQRGLDEGQRRLEATILENQRRTDAVLIDLQAGLRDVNQRVDRLDGRIDRLFYAIIGMGGALLVATIASNYLGG